jgi:hypothetical protein
MEVIDRGLQICIFTTLLFLAIVQLIVGECSVIISEINADSPSTLRKQNQFIELRFNCPDGEKPDLDGIKMMIIKPIGGTSASTQANCEFYLTMRSAHNPTHWKQNTERDFYLLIGGDDKIVLPNGDEVVVDIPFKSESIRSREKFSTGQSSLFDHISVHGKRIPLAIVLLRASGSLGVQLNSDLQKMSKSRPYVPISAELKKLILDNKKTIIDVTIYGVRTPFTTCDVFDIFSEDFSEMPAYVLNEWDGVQSDLSINYCGDEIFMAKSPHLFKYGKITPGKRNDCTNPEYIIDKSLLSMRWFGQRETQTSLQSQEEELECQS